MAQAPRTPFKNPSQKPLLLLNLNSTARPLLRTLLRTFYCTTKYSRDPSKIKGQKRTPKPKNRTNRTEEFSEQFEGTTQ